MSPLLVVVCLLSCFLPLIVAQSGLTRQIVMVHYDNGGCYADGTAIYHYWSNNTCIYDHLITNGPSRYIQPRIISNRTIQLCFSSTNCYFNSTCSTYPTNQCLWDLSGSSWRLSLAGTAIPTILPPTSPPTPTPSLNSTIIYTYYQNPSCYYDAWTFSRIWYNGVCTVDSLERATAATSLKATLYGGNSVQICQYSDSFTHCDSSHNPQCNNTRLNTCVPTPARSGWMMLRLASTPNPTTMPPTIRPTAAPTQPPVISGRTVVYTSYVDNYCGFAQSPHNWYNGSCIADSFDYYSYYANVNILPRIISASMVEVCIHNDPFGGVHCTNDIYSCRLYATNVCINNPSGFGTFRLQVPGVPTIAPTPEPTSFPTPTPTPGPLLMYMHYEDSSCSVVSTGYPRVWNQNTVNYEYVLGQWFPFNATLQSSREAQLCLEYPSERECQSIALGRCLNGPLNSGMFMLQILNGSLPTLTPTVAPTPGPTTPSPTAYPMGATNIIYTRYTDAACQQLDEVAGVQSYVNGKCDAKPFNNQIQQVKANLEAGAKSVELCASPNACNVCETLPLDTCIQDAGTFIFYRFTISGPPTASPDSSSSGLSTGVVVGLVSAGIVGILILGLIIYCYRKHRQQTKQDTLHMQQDGGYTRV